MRWLRAVVIVFSTCSRIPVPKVKWDNDAVKLSYAFLPLVGGAVGAAVWLWQFLCRAAGISAVFFAAVAVALPVIVTGGIHMDGYCDTSDALASWQDSGRKLEILKDHHVGAFAVIRFGIYIIINFGLLYEIFERGYDAGLGLLFVLSRCFAALYSLTTPNAKKDGMQAAFSASGPNRGAVFAIVGLFSLIGLAGWGWLTFPQGMGVLLCLPVTLLHRAMAKRHFGGVTGDIIGHYLQITELTLLAGLLAGGLIWL
jgi:adenosylcobinamide-GDP ribazoletransferase